MNKKLIDRQIKIHDIDHFIDTLELKGGEVKPEYTECSI